MYLHPLLFFFRDYGNKGLIIAILINFAIIGAWHGANLTFLVFGLLHGCYYIPLILSGKLNKRKKLDKDKWLPSAKEALNMGLTFLLVMLAFIIFRSATLLQAGYYFAHLFSGSVFSLPEVAGKLNFMVISFFTLVVLVIEWLQRSKEYGLQITPAVSFTYMNARRLGRWGVYLLIICSVLCFGGKEQDFIYFKF